MGDWESELDGRGAKFPNVGYGPGAAIVACGLSDGGGPR